MAIENTEYQPVETTDLEDQEFKEQSDDNASSTTLLNQKGGSLSKFHYLRRDVARVPYLWVFAINCTILAVAIVLFISAHIAKLQSAANLEYSRQQNRHFDAHCNEKVSTYSPAFDAIKYKTYEFEATFDLKNVYKGTPRPELEEAWDRLIHGGNFPVDEDVMHRINKTENLSYAVKFPEETGGGYVAGLEMFHQMHCVNFLRQYTYREYYEDTVQAFTDGEELLRLHLDHCVDILRQVVMCNADVTLITGVWVEGYPRLSADFNTQHKCRDYEALIEWNQENANRPESYAHLRKPEGAKQMAEPAWVKMQGSKHSTGTSQ